MDRSLLDLDYHILNQTKDTMRHPEFGESVFISPDKSTVVTTPLTEIERRVRRGDDIDLAESMALDDPREWPTERFLPIPEPTYPYTSWAFSDGRREDVSITRKRELYEKVLQRLDPADVKAADFVSGALVRMAQESGYSDFDAYKSDLHPDVPILVICQLAYLGMANPIEAAHAVLRPCVYTRWDV